MLNISGRISLSSCHASSSHSHPIDFPSRQVRCTRMRLSQLVTLSLVVLILCAVQQCDCKKVSPPGETPCPSNAGQIQRQLHERTFTAGSTTRSASTSTNAKNDRQSLLVNPPISPKKATRLVFGSCNRQTRPDTQTAWEHIEKLKPDSFVWMGDVVYLDRAMPVSRIASFDCLSHFSFLISLDCN